MSQRVLSGIQPTGSLHLGNYFGAIQNYVALQDRYESIYCVVDLHALTSRPRAEDLKKNTLEAAKILLSCGLDPKRCVLFVQSHVPAHAELAWILACSTAYGDLTRMTQFKEKGDLAQSKGDIINTGIFTYPVLQAADILAYRAEIVPVGDDQLQHLELAREIVRRFNATYGETFPEPRPLLSTAKRVIGLDGEAKMSKSRGNDIGILDAPDVVKKKLASAKTDIKRLRRNDPGEPKDCNIFALHQFVTSPEKIAEIETGCRSASLGCVDCKGIFAASVEHLAGPIRARAEVLERRPDDIKNILRDGAGRANAIAEATMETVRKKIGIGEF
ncbi:MAG: tryptophan--tRNA ligase [Planctomycetes bacterium]|nr:tryptophan--tRNA ligase [Planctomycetota bacterium]